MRSSKAGKNETVDCLEIHRCVVKLQRKTKKMMETKSGIAVALRWRGMQ